MDNWLKWAIPLAAGAGILATGGAAAPLLGTVGAEGAAAAGAAGAGVGDVALAGYGTGLAEGAGGGLLATAPESTSALLASAPEASSAMTYATPSIFSSAETVGADAAATTAPAGYTDGMASLDKIAAQQAAESGYVGGSDTALNGIAASQPGYTANGAGLDKIAAQQGWRGYAGDIGRAGKGYATFEAAFGGQAGQQRPPPQARPVFTGQAPQISQQQQRQPNQFAQQLLNDRLRQRPRGMLG
jgi:hypothetical protein